MINLLLVPLNLSGNYFKNFVYIKDDRSAIINNEWSSFFI